MSKFNEMMSKEHVRNHPMFTNFGERIRAMRENMSRKGAAPDLKDIFSSQRAVGMGSNDRSVRAFIQEAALSARSVLDMLDFPMQPQLSFNNVKNVKMAAHDDSQVVDAEVLFNVRICTKSGAIRQALIPVTVSRGVIVPPSTIIYNQQMRVIAQSTVDEIVQRNTAYQLPPMRRMYDPPLIGQELDNAASERNTLGWIPREVVTDGAGLRHSNRQAQHAGPKEGDYIINEISTGEADAPGEYRIEVAGYGDEEFGGQSYHSLDEAMDAIRGTEFLSDTETGHNPNTNSIWLVDAHGRTERVGWELDHSPERMDHFASYAKHLVGQDASNPRLPRDVKNPGGEGGGVARSSDDVIDPLATEPSKVWGSSRKAQDKTNPGTPRSLGVPGSEDTQMIPQDGTHVAPGPSMAEDPNLTQLARPGYERSIPGYQGLGQYSPAATPSDELFRQIMAQPTVSQQVQEIFSSLTPESITNQVMQMVGPLLASTGIDQNEIDWAYLVDELNSSFGGLMAQQRTGKIGMAEVRKVALLIAEYVTGRRRFGRRRAAASTADAITEMVTYLQSAKDTFKPEEYAYYEQLAQEAQSALQNNDEQTAKDLLMELENAFSFTDIPTETVSDPYWSTFVATCKKLAQQTNLVKEDEVDEDGNKPMKRYMPAGYDLVLEDMVKAEEDGLDSFPRPYSHIERNYILRRYPTCSRDRWLPHLINDGFAINPYGKGNNRGRPVREGSNQATKRSFEGSVRTASIPENEVSYDIRMEPEHEQIEGNASAIDPVTDKEIVEHIKEELRNGNDWAWCQVRVVASYVDDDGNEYTGESSWLGDCSYESEQDFIKGGYYDDMKKEAYEDLLSKVHGSDEDLSMSMEQRRSSKSQGTPFPPKFVSEIERRVAQMDDEGAEDDYVPNVRAKRDLRTSDGDRIKMGTEGFLMWTRGNTVEVLVPPSIQDSFRREDWEDIGPAQVPSREAQVDEEVGEPEEVETGYNWEAIKKKMESEPWTTGWEGTGPGEGAVRSVYLGQMINPSGKFYMPWTTNQTDEDVEKDQAFWEKLEEEASAAGYSITSGEGDPTDTFVIEFKAWDEFPPHEQAALESGEDVYEGQLEEELTMSPEEKGR